MLIEGNRRFVTDFGAAYARFLRELAEADNLPLVFHCTGGKDRAGFAAALALLAVGVPRETVIEDFLKTNTYTADRIARNLLILRVVSLFRTDPELARPLLGVERAYIEAALDTIEREYGGVENYLRNELGIDDDTLSKLRANLLQS
ncbi:MAG: tyrosine-protein phosphatase [Gammaproteobacteria bacterium]|nr:tyrosine-protein phosphatase [Gammaproteobacteria bacterium]